MKLSKLFSAISSRQAEMSSYFRTAPCISALPKWLLLGAVRSRLLGGTGRFTSSQDGKPRDFLMPIGKAAGQSVVIDVSSTAELDVLEEVVVGQVYPFEKIGIRPQMVIDCGANIGTFASMCRVLFPNSKLICWEPDHHNFSRLIAQPLLQGKAVSCYQAAISDREEEALFLGGGTGGRLSSTAEFEQGQWVRTIDFRSWLEMHVEVPLLIKIDIEGYEVKVINSLKGAWPKPCALFLETHAPYGNDEGTLEVLRSEGFCIELLRSHGLPADSRVFKEYLAKLS